MHKLLYVSSTRRDFPQDQLKEILSVARANNTRLGVTGEAEQLQVSGEGLVKFCMLFTPESEIPLDLEGMWNFSNKLAAARCRRP